MVVNRINNVVYRIRKTPHSREKVVHLDRLAPFEERTRTESPGPGTSSQPLINWEHKLPFGISLRKKKPLSIIVEGNIGCGKTTFTKRFLSDHRVCTLLEPLDQYPDVAGVNLLQLMYEDPDRYCYQFQHHVQQVMYDRHLLLTSRPVKIMERSMFSGYCFIETHHRAAIVIFHGR
ncbi:deoxynucleoside kinase-like [Diprion similis]|uniref:deoxynucleoside kinase-like n=1 Tax=Diprion similis TaxID=362088 RepID=UPI001EF883DF|nr:deoxynucleoside kinase-like [Diprion similis]